MRYSLLPLILFCSDLPAAWFQGPAPFTMTRQFGVPIWLASADMNRDGIADLVAVHSGAPLRLRGATTIGVAVVPPDGPLIVSETPFSGDIIDATIADFNADASPDVLVIDRGAFGGDRLCVASGTGAGSIGAIFCTNLTEYADHVAAGDFNGDGRPDAVVTHSLTGQISLWYGRGDGTFTAGPVAAVANPGVLAVADFNADGIADVAVHSRAGRLHLLTSAQGAPLRTTLTFAASSTFSSIAAGDINRDGRPDVVACDTLSSEVAVLYAPFAQPMVATETAVAPRLVQLTDLNGDSVTEILVSTSAGMMVAQVGVNGSLTLPAAPGFSLASSTPVAVIDLNRDRMPDLVTYTGALGQSLSLLIAQPSATSALIETSAQSSVYGQRVTITARAIASTTPLPVTPVSGGRFTLYRAGQVVQEMAATPAINSSAQEVASARFNVTLPVGAHDVTATFSGAPGFVNSTSSAVRMTVQTSPATIRLVSTANEIPRDQGLRLSATVTTPNGLAIDGVVKLFLNGAFVSQSPVSNGSAQLAVSPGLPLGKVRVNLSFESGGYAPATTGDVEFVVRGTLVAGNAATYRGPLTPDSLAVAAVPGLVPSKVSAELRRTGAATVVAGIVYAGDGQVNLFIPASAPVGPAMLHILLDGVSVASGDVTITHTAPGLFLVGADGVPAALAALYSASGAATGVPVFTCSNTACVLAPLDTGADGKTLVLTLFGTGWRNAERVTAMIGDTPLEVLFAGPQPETPGFDQANIVLPKTLAGGGDVVLQLTADGIAANSVRLRLQ